MSAAPTTDPEKAFDCATSGVVLGVHYDTVKWIWAIPAEKLARVLLQLRTALSEDSLAQHEMWSLVGRVLHYAPLIPGGKFNIVELIKAGSASTDRNARVEMTASIRRQAYFWWAMLKTTTGLASIPTATRLPAWTLEYFTDASGGSELSPGHGTGGIGGKFWFLVPWGRKINSGARSADGRRLCRKLSALELVGPLICVAADLANCRGRPLRVWVDNAGSIGIWRKGYSTRCGLCTTIANAINRVATANGCTMAIEKITRCSNTGSILADELSKGRFAAFQRKLPRDWPINQSPPGSRRAFYTGSPTRRSTWTWVTGSSETFRNTTLQLAEPQARASIYDSYVICLVLILHQNKISNFSLRPAVSFLK
jgi:hypothetical protein